MQYKYTKSRQDTQLKGEESSDFMGTFADNHSSFSRKSFSRGRPARASRPRKVPCPGGQGTVCKTVQGGPTPPGASDIFLLHNVTVICIDDSRVRREAGAVLFGIHGIFRHICGVEVRGRGRSAAAASPVPIFTDIRNGTHILYYTRD